MKISTHIRLRADPVAVVEPAIPGVEAVPVPDDDGTVAVVRDVVVAQEGAGDVAVVTRADVVAPVVVVDLEDAVVDAGVRVGVGGGRVVGRLVVGEAHPVAHRLTGEAL